jgi:hypothetical protein
MNSTDQLDTFEAALLTELRREVAEHPAEPSAPAPALRRPPRRRLRVAALAAAAVAAFVATVLGVGGPAGTGSLASAAYAVEKAPDGGVVVTIHALEDAAGLETALADEGVDATVDFEADGLGEADPHGGIRYEFNLPLGNAPAGTRPWSFDMDELCGPLDPAPATLEHAGDDWVLTIPAGSPLLSRRLAINTDGEGQLLVSYDGSEPGTGCMVFGD